MVSGRRRAIQNVGAMLAAGVGGVALMRVAPAAAAPPPQPPLPWPYAPIEPTLVAERAYWAYFDGHCMYSVFAGVVGELGARRGYPFQNFPLELMKYGAGGVAGWGTLCGTLNGAAAAIYLVSPDPDPVIDEVFWWYGNEELPDFVPPESPKPVARSVARSPICHVSVARWCEATGLAAYSKERNERCARLAASTARFTAEVLNRQHAGTFAVEHRAPEEVRRCRSCHERGGEVENVRSRMDCGPCHPGVGADHPAGARRKPKPG